MISKILKNLQRIETCSQLSEEEVIAHELGFLSKNVIKVDTEILLSQQVTDVIIYINFPDPFLFKSPKFFLDKKFYDSHKYLPHINQDYSICIIDESLNNSFDEENISGVLESMLYESKRILEKGILDNDYKKEEFEREFKAYWELNYSKKDEKKLIGFETISTHVTPPVTLKGIKFIKPFNNKFSYFISDDNSIFDSYISYFENIKISYKEIKIFYIDSPFDLPPHERSYLQALDYIKKYPELYKEFKSIVNSSPNNEIVVAFSHTHNSSVKYYGWSYSNFEPLNSSYKSTINWMSSKLLGSNHNINRISFESLTNDRLDLRTSGYKENNFSVTVTGLGSVGSNLIYFLNNLPINKFHLIEPQTLRVENINRHFSGFSDLDQLKVTSIASYIKHSLPSKDVKTFNGEVHKIISENVSFINETDYHIVAIGNTLIEKYLLSELINNTLTKPIIFFWVEPYLASGQMLIVNPKDSEKFIDIIENFEYSVLEEKQQDKTYLIEGGCQNGYFPYSSSLLIQFLSAIFPYLKDTLCNNNTDSRVISWVGDKAFLKSKSLNITSFGNMNDSFSVIVKRI